MSQPAGQMENKTRMIQKAKQQTSVRSKGRLTSGRSKRLMINGHKEKQYEHISSGRDNIREQSEIPGKTKDT